MPFAAESPQTFFHLAHHLHRSIGQDATPTLALLHRGKPAAQLTIVHVRRKRIDPSALQAITDTMPTQP